jgi:hypothetical protein
MSSGKGISQRSSGKGISQRSSGKGISQRSSGKGSSTHQHAADLAGAQVERGPHRAFAAGRGARGAFRALAVGSGLAEGGANDLAQGHVSEPRDGGKGEVLGAGAGGQQQVCRVANVAHGECEGHLWRIVLRPWRIMLREQ